MVMEEVRAANFDFECDLVLLALGFLGPEPDGIVDRTRAEARSARQHRVRQLCRACPASFAAGDSRRGQSLVVWAIWEGRECARAVDAYLMGETFLPASPDL
jgi:glutamate synthase (NADPH/NADH) small chain